MCGCQGRPGLPAPSTLGTFLRAFTFGHARQLDAVASRLPADLAGRTPLLPGAAQVAFLGIDSRRHGDLRVCQAARRVRVLGGQGPERTACGRTPRTTTTTGSPRSGRARQASGITTSMDRAVTRAITTIPESAWVTIKHPRAIWDQDEERGVCDAQVAEIDLFTAFTSRKKSEHVTARLIVRRVKRFDPKSVPVSQSELFSAWRHHAVFTDSCQAMLAAEATHRAHATIEQVNADLKAGPRAHFPSSRMNANAAWLVLAAMAFNLTRAAGPRPRNTTPRRPPPRSAPTSSPSQPGSRAPPAACASRWTGPGNRPGERCSTPSSRNHQPRPDHPASLARPRIKWKARADRQHARA